MLTLAGPASSDLLIRKSRFIGCVQPIAGRAAALSAVGALRSAHPGAAHVCWAMLAGGESAAVDDGEPAGTAGRPMLEVLRHHDLDGVLATVVRYFGGIKLGAGGLLRAYTEAVALALRGAVKVPVQRLRELRCAVGYPLEDAVRREAALAGASLLEASHGSLAVLRFSLDDAQAARFIERVNQITQGSVRWGS